MGVRVEGLAEGTAIDGCLGKSQGMVLDSAC